MPALTKNQDQRIKEAVERARRSRDAYVQKDYEFIRDALAGANDEVLAEIRRLDDIAGLTPGQTFQIKRLNEVKKNIDRICDDLKKRLSVLAKDGVDGSFTLGVRDGIADLRDIQIPSYSALSANQVDDLAVSVFGVIDRSALDFLTRLKIDLLGDITDQLKQGIKSKITDGIIGGKSTPQIVRDIGRIIKDEEAFKRAGKTVFKTAQQRAQLIARTETNRAHNQGRLKFYDTVGVKKVQWWATLDRRTAPEDASYHGRIFEINKTPAIPLHPNCRCSVFAFVENIDHLRLASDLG
jgi:SPP1 gp7 family putative phage head morphogenesis protein